MKNLCRSLLVVLLFASPAFAWNSTGHMIVAELAWQRLTAAQQQSAVAILKEHPHWTEYLIADKPDNVPQDQWAFWRSATWPDWIKQEHRELSHNEWHYVDLPFIPPGAVANPPAQPKGELFVVLPTCIQKARASTGQDRAINFCWVMHLVGDLHQPLHCSAMYSETFPKGDEGGNMAFYRIQGRGVIKLHSFWDDLLGKGKTASAIKKGAKEANDALAANRADVNREEMNDRTLESWIRESNTWAVKYAYLDGKVLPAYGSGRRQEPANVPEVPESYATDAGRVARICVGTAGERLAAVLGQVLH